MTVAFAFPCGTDVVLAADTLVSDEYTKSYQVKFREVGGAIQLSASGDHKGPDVMTGWCVLVGAGRGGLVDALMPELQMAFLDNPKSNGDVLRKALEQVMMEFYKDHLAPIPEQDHPVILIGLQRPGTYPILVSDSTTLRMPSPLPIGAIGFGGDFAQELLERLWVPDMELWQAHVLAAYVAYRAKQSIQWCGGDTTIRTVHGLVMKQQEGVPATLEAPPRAITRVPVEYTRELERIFLDEWDVKERELVWELIPKCPKP